MAENSPSSPPDAAPRLLLACGDLFFATQLRSAAERAGAVVDLELSAAGTIQKLRGGRARWAVVDLELPQLDIGAVVAALPESDRPLLIAFGPHVQTARLAAARQAGCDRVVSRGEISATLPRLLAEAGD